MYVRGIRGATTVRCNEEDEILTNTRELLTAIIAENHLAPEDICSVLVTVTSDVDAAFPAKAIRDLPGWELVPVMCSLEISVANALPLCIRLMVHANTTKRQNEIAHVYLNDAKKLRPDLANR